jgi:hypothetical protein
VGYRKWDGMFDYLGRPGKALTIRQVQPDC